MDNWIRRAYQRNILKHIFDDDDPGIWVAAKPEVAEAKTPSAPATTGLSRDEGDMPDDPEEYRNRRAEEMP